MRAFIKSAILFLIPVLGFCQSPQIPLTGNIGAAGNFPLINSPAVVFAFDANHTMAYPEMSGSGGFIKVTSSVSLTATRNLVAPLTKGFQFTIENSTTGGQSIQIIGTTGVGITISNGSTVTVTSDGTNYVSSTSSGGSGISGLTANYIPLAGSATTITGNSHLDDGVTNAGAITSSEPIYAQGLIAEGTSVLYNPTPATSSANQNSPSWVYDANFWNGSSSQQANFFWQNVLGAGTNPSSTFTLFNNYSGPSPGPSSYSVNIPYPITVTSCTGCGGGGGSPSGPAGGSLSGTYPNPTLTDAGVSTSGIRSTLQTVSGTINYGDSTVAYIGASDSQYIFGAQLQNDVPGTWIHNWGIPGTNVPQIAAMVWSTWDPTNTFAAPLVTYEGGINDANNLPGNTTGGVNHAILSETAGIAHIALSWARTEVMSSAAASSTGTWSSYVVPGSSFVLSPAISGTMMQSSTNGSTRTYTLPASANVVYTWLANDASAGTFTVSVNGTLQTNLCTGTTTFNSFGCNGQAITVNGGYALFSQVFSGNSGGANTIVVTVTSATSGSNLVVDVSASTIPTSTAGLPIIGVQGVLRQNLDHSSASTAAYDTALHGVYTTLYTAGLTNLFFVDVRNGIASGPGYPAAAAINTTTDYVSTTSAGGLIDLHPNDAGYKHLADLYESSGAAAGFNIFVKNIGSRSSTQPGGQVFLPHALSADYSNDIKLNQLGLFDGNLPMPGTCFYQNLGPANGLNKTCAIRMAYENSQHGFLEKMTYAGFGCQFSFVTSNDLCGAWMVDPNVGFMIGRTTHIGAGVPNGPYTQPAISQVIGLSIDSQQQATSNAATTYQATTMYLETGIINVQLPACQARTGVYGSNYMMWYIKDSTDTGSITFSPNTSVGTDTINGAASVIYSNIPQFTVFEAHCSQSVASSGTITLVETFPSVVSSAGHPDYASIQGALFATSAMLGPVFYESKTTQMDNITIRLSGTISCTGAPTVVMMDLGTSPTTAYGSATVISNDPTGTSDGVYAYGPSLGVAITAGHYYGFAFSVGTCVTAPNFDIVATIK